MFKSVAPWVLGLAFVVAGPLMASEEPKKPAAAEPKKEEPKKPAAAEPKKEDAKKPADAKPADAKPAMAASGAMVGKPAPAFSGKDMTGKEWKNADFTGKVVVLEWFNDQCPVCKRHAEGHTAANVMKKFDGKPVVWVAVNSTKGQETRKAEIEDFAKKNGLTFPILADADGKIGKAFGAKTTPHIFVIDQKGNVAYVGAIDDDKDGEKAKSKSAITNYAEQAVDALLKGTTPATATTEPYGCSVKY